MTMNKTFEKFVDRAAVEVGAYGNHRTAHELVNAETIAAARCQLVNGELASFTEFCYEQVDGWFVNLSGNSQIPTGVWAPWGSSGRGRLSRLERDITRLWLKALAQQAKKTGKAKPLFFYNAGSRRWHVDTVTYPTVEDARRWLEASALTPKTWLQGQKRLQGNKQ